MTAVRAGVLILGIAVAQACSGSGSMQTAPSVDAISAATPMLYLRQRLGMDALTDVSTYDALTFDPADREYGVVRYKLAYGTRVRIRIVLRNKPSLVIRTLVDMEDRPAGLNEERWDGRDQSGNIVDNTKSLFVIQANPPPHDKHRPERCRELSAELQVRKDEGRSSNPRIQVDLLGRDWVVDEKGGYSVRVFVDEEEVYDDRVGIGDFPLVRKLEASAFSAGRHMVTVNVADQDDHIGVARREVFLAGQR